jgi:hypothetical protein
MKIPNHLLMCRFVSRFRMVPTFGQGTIRKFSNNVSEMKKLAARDFEDILQVSISLRMGFCRLPDRLPVLDSRF